MTCLAFFNVVDFARVFRIDRKSVSRIVPAGFMGPLLSDSLTFDASRAEVPFFPFQLMKAQH